MKVKVNTKKATFQPIELVITIENEQDLINLWYRFNISESVINKNASNHFNGKMCTDSHYDVWDKLNDLAIERNLRDR